jgi:hypothetical protein
MVLTGCGRTMEIPQIIDRCAPATTGDACTTHPQKSVTKTLRSHLVARPSFGHEKDDSRTTFDRPGARCAINAGELVQQYAKRIVA